MASVDRVHAAEHDVAAGDRAYRVGIKQASGWASTTVPRAIVRIARAATSTLSRPCCASSIVALRIRFRFFSSTWSGSTKTRVPTQFRANCSIRGLPVPEQPTTPMRSRRRRSYVPAPKVCATRRPNSETGESLGAGRPEGEVVADNVDRGDRAESAAIVDQPSDHSPRRGT